MPNGVICGGAVDGSNQAGEMVTCHAITARPDGAAAAPGEAAAPRATTATNSKRKAWNEVMRTLRAAMVERMERSADGRSRLRRRQRRTALRRRRQVKRRASPSFGYCMPCMGVTPDGASDGTFVGADRGSEACRGGSTA